MGSPPSLHHQSTSSLHTPSRVVESQNRSMDWSLLCYQVNWCAIQSRGWSIDRSSWISVCTYVIKSRRNSLQKHGWSIYGRRNTNSLVSHPGCSTNIAYIIPAIRIGFIKLTRSWQTHFFALATERVAWWGNINRSTTNLWHKLRHGVVNKVMMNDLQL